MVPFFVQIKCQLGQSYEVANKLADAELASEIYSTAGDFDLLVKFYVEDKTDIGHFVNERVQTIPGIQGTRTIITLRRSEMQLVLRHHVGRCPRATVGGCPSRGRPSVLLKGVSALRPAAAI